MGGEDIAKKIRLDTLNRQVRARNSMKQLGSLKQNKSNILLTKQSSSFVSTAENNNKNDSFDYDNPLGNILP